MYSRNRLCHCPAPSVCMSYSNLGIHVTFRCVVCNSYVVYHRCRLSQPYQILEMRSFLFLFCRTPFAISKLELARCLYIAAVYHLSRGCGVFDQLFFFPGNQSGGSNLYAEACFGFISLTVAPSGRKRALNESSGYQRPNTPLKCYHPLTP